jgi:hypothetical protein
MAVEFNTWKKAVEIPTDCLVFTDWNCNEMTEQKLAHLQDEIANEENPEDPHFDEPLQVIPIKDSDKFLVVGGEHRTKIARALEMRTVPCVIRYDLAKLDRKDLMLWTVRRNNLRGRLNAQKYAEMESELIEQHGMTSEAARRSMLVDGDLAKALRASVAVRLNEDNDSDDGHDGTRQFGDDVANAQDQRRSKEELLQALKIAEQDVLLYSADTVEHGYLFFIQGKRGQSHLVVDETETLNEMVKSMVKACKGSDARVDEFLIGAIRNELKNRE